MASDVVWWVHAVVLAPIEFHETGIVSDELVVGVSLLIALPAKHTQESHEEHCDYAEKGNIAKDQVDKHPEVPLRRAAVGVVPEKHIGPDEHEEVEPDEDPVHGIEQTTGSLVLEV